jgi:hypothetical protein
MERGLPAHIKSKLFIALYNRIKAFALENLAFEALKFQNGIDRAIAKLCRGAIHRAFRSRMTDTPGLINRAPTQK